MTLRTEDTLLTRAGGPSLGKLIKAYRLGYHDSIRNGGFIRMSDAGPHTRIDLAPYDNIPNGKHPKTHRCWWDDPGILGMIEPLRLIRHVKMPFSFFVDDQGRLVE